MVLCGLEATSKPICGINPYTTYIILKIIPGVMPGISNFTCTFYYNIIIIAQVD